MKKIIFTVGLSLVMVAGYSVELSKVDEAKFNAAVKAYRMNQGAKALTLFTELYNAHPQNQQIKNNYAVVLFGSGKLEKAEEVLSSVIESNKEVNVAYKNLNKIYDYAAAKAYSNALGTEKEVKPQKLQLIETLPAPAQESVAPAAIEPLPATVPAVVSSAAAEKPLVPAHTAGAPIVKIGDIGIVAETLSKAETNSLLASTLSDATEPMRPATPPNTQPVPEVIVKSVMASDKGTPLAKATPESDPKMAGEIAAVESAVNNWAQAWSKGDADSYITFYEPTFTVGRMSHTQWINNRKQHISPSENIQVKLSDLVVTPSKGDDTIVAKFKQSYQAKHYQDVTIKQLVWKKVGDKWFIKKEIKVS